MAETTRDYLDRAKNPLTLRLFPGHRILCPFLADGPVPTPNEVALYLCPCERNLVLFRGLEEAAVVVSQPGSSPSSLSACPCCGVTAEEAVAAARRHHAETAHRLTSSG